MPVVASPSRGYADWQRVSNFDSDLLYQVENKVVAVQDSTPLYDVSRYAYLGGYIREFSSYPTVTVNWFADPAGTILVGTKAFAISASIPDGAYLRIPNLGPWVSVTFDAVAGLPFTYTARLFATNRVHPLEFMPPFPYLLTVSAKALAAGANDLIYPNGYYAGPIQVWLNSPGASWSLRFITFGPAGSAVFVDQTTIATGTGTYKLIVPSGAWWVNMRNDSAIVGNYSITVVPSLTGSS
jgi:hypothetical protein